MYLKLFDLHKLKMVHPMLAAAINYNKRLNFFYIFFAILFFSYIMKCCSTHSFVPFQTVNTIYQISQFYRTGFSILCIEINDP